MTTESPVKLSPRMWPAISKTQRMHDIEAEHGGSDIRVVILHVLKLYPKDRLAAAQLGILPSTMSHWIPKLGIVNEVMAIRKAREAS